MLPRLRNRFQRERRRSVVARDEGRARRRLRRRYDVAHDAPRDEEAGKDAGRAERSVGIEGGEHDSELRRGGALREQRDETNLAVMLRATVWLEGFLG